MKNAVYCRYEHFSAYYNMVKKSNEVYLFNRIQFNILPIALYHTRPWW